LTNSGENSTPQLPSAWIITYKHNTCIAISKIYKYHLQNSVAGQTNNQKVNG